MLISFEPVLITVDVGSREILFAELSVQTENLSIAFKGNDGTTQFKHCFPRVKGLNGKDRRSRLVTN